MTQTNHRDVVRGGVMRSSRTAPGHRFDMHRPERLNGDRASRSAQRRRAAATALTPLLAQKFCRFSNGFRAFELLQPAIKCRLCEPMLATIFGPRKTASAPRFNVRRPISAPRRFLESFRCYRRSFHVRRNPLCREIALPRERAETGRLRGVELDSKIKATVLFACKVLSAHCYCRVERFFTVCVFPHFISFSTP